MVKSFVYDIPIELNRNHVLADDELTSVRCQVFYDHEIVTNEVFSNDLMALLEVIFDFDNLNDVVKLVNYQHVSMAVKNNDEEVVLVLDSLRLFSILLLLLAVDVDVDVDVDYINFERMLVIWNVLVYIHNIYRI